MLRDPRHLIYRSKCYMLCALCHINWTNEKAIASELEPERRRYIHNVNVDDYSNRNKIAMFCTLLQMESDTYKSHSSDFIDTHSRAIISVLLASASHQNGNQLYGKRGGQAISIQHFRTVQLELEKQAKNGKQKDQVSLLFGRRKRLWPDDNNHKLIRECRFVFRMDCIVSVSFCCLIAIAPSLVFPLFS